MKYYNPVTSFQKGSESPPIEYPVTNPSYSNLNNVISPRVGKQYGVRPPTLPGQRAFDKMMDEFLMVRDHVQRDKWPASYLSNNYPSFLPSHEEVSTGAVPEPIRDANINENNPKAAALLVRMDLPSDLGNFIFRYLVREGVQFRYTDRKASNEFHKGLVLFNRMLWDEMEHATKKFFEVKYFYGSSRPEEDLGIPGCVLTSYNEGCPRHPRYIAGHGTLAGVTLRVIERFFLLKENPIVNVIAAVSCYHFAQYRTFAGVHYTEDNVEGLRFGYKMAFHTN